VTSKQTTLTLAKGGTLTHAVSQIQVGLVNPYGTGHTLMSEADKVIAKLSAKGTKAVYNRRICFILTNMKITVKVK